MSFRDITPGNKTAKPIAARFIKSSVKGTPGIEVSFEFEDHSTGILERLNWVAWLSDKAKEHSMETLVTVLGCNGAEDVDGDGVFTDPNFLDYEKEVQIVVELEPGRNSDGSPKLDMNGDPLYYPQIKWVNNLGGSGYGKCTPEVVKQELAATGFKACFMTTVKTTNTTVKRPAPGSQSLKTSDLPF